MVIDFRNLNSKTIKDSHPLPNIADILDQLGRSEYFSTFDLAMGFNQIPMDPNSAHKTAFSTPYGHYQYKKMPFGLCSAPATFQRMMEKVLTGLQGIEMLVYMDDIIVHAKNLEDHDKKVSKLFDRLARANLVLQPEKCDFLKLEVAYLGHLITRDGVKPDPSKIESIRDFPSPTCTKDVRSFLGTTRYYRRFMKDYVKIS